MINLVEMAHNAAERLRGTCLTIASLGEDFEALENDSKFCAELDQLVFCCTDCDWWHELSEMADGGDWVCEECA